MRSYSILRNEQYKQISKLTINGSILDIGGSIKSGYHELIKGDHKILTSNIDDKYGCDIVFDVEKTFPIQDNTYDAILAINLLEHIFEYNNVYSEVFRTLKPGGFFIQTTPYMHHIHGSPDDYHRYTDSFYKRVAAKYGFEIQTLDSIGFGLFSLIYQCIGGIIPSEFLKNIVRNTFVCLDKTLLHIPKYNKLKNIIPLGYFIIMKKK